MIKIEGVKKYYNRNKRNQITAIDNTSLELEDKGLVAILGNSGCGKTTLLNMIGGLDKPDSGKIYINGKKMNGSSSSKTDNIRNINIGYIFQNYHLVDNMTVFDNVALPLKMLGVKDKSIVKEHVLYALEKVGLYRFRNRPASALSGGERQRVGIARAIVKNPSIIIADEPTGNLDSGNSLEIMKIIKTISKEKLVILVTHERSLADFYSDRIIEIVDGKVVSDKLNDHDNTLDYRIDNKIYLQDFANKEVVNTEDFNVSFYSDGSAKCKVSVVVRNGNLYIECQDKKIEVVDSDSAIELVNDHYHALSKDEAEKQNFDYGRLELSGRRKYHSVFKLGNMLKSGISRIMSYKAIKKLLLLGFVAASMFILYSVSNVVGIRTIKDDYFVSQNKNYLFVSTSQNSADDILRCKEIEGVEYVIPGRSNIFFIMDYTGFYYQSNQYTDQFSGSMTAMSVLDKDSLICGKIPEKENEILLDKRVVQNVIDEGYSSMLGFKEMEDFIGWELRSGASANNYKLVGICDSGAPNIFVDDSRMYSVLMDNNTITYYNEDNSANVEAISKASDKLVLKKGSMPEKDYQVIIPIDYQYDKNYKIGKTIPGKVNGKTVEIVGYYSSENNMDNMFYCNENTYLYKWMSTTSGITIYPNNKDAVISYYRGINADIKDTYETAKSEYEEYISSEISTTTIISAIVFGVSLIEIYLMLRSSFLSRVKEVGILRAIGLKKKDVYKMFLGEILVITIPTTAVGFGIMGYILSALIKVEYFAQSYAFNWQIVLASAVIIFIFNILVGLLPVFNTLRKTPAAILARTDID